MFLFFSFGLDQLKKLIDCQASLTNDTSERADLDVTVIRNRNRRLTVIKVYVIAARSDDAKTRPLKRANGFAP